MSERKLGVVLSYANIGVTLIVNLLYTPIMLRLLGQGEYGVYSLALSVIGYLSLLYAGMTSLYLRYISRYRSAGDSEQEARFNGLFVVLFSTLGIVALVFGFMLSQSLELFFGALTAAEIELARVLFIIMALNMAFSMLNTVFYTIVYSREHFVVVKSIDILRAGIVPALTLPLLLMGYGSVAMSVTLLLGTLLCLVLTAYYSIRRLRVRFCFKNIPFGLLPDMFSFSIFIILQSVMDQFNWQLAKFLLGSVVDSSAIAVYTVGLQIALVFINFAAAFAGVMTPRIYQLATEGNGAELNALWRRVGRYQFYVVYFILVGFAFMGRDFLCLWAGESYGQAYYVALLLMAPVSVHLCQMLAVDILRAKNLHARWIMVHLALSVVGFALCIPLTLKYGVLGVAVGTGLTSFVGANIYDNYYYHKTAGLDVKKFFASLLQMWRGIVAVAILAAAGSLVTLTTWTQFLAMGLVFATLYAPLMYYLAMNNDERRLVKNAFRRVRNFRVKGNIS